MKTFRVLTIRNAVTAAGAIAIVFLVYYFTMILSTSELKDKSAWAMLQGVELEHRNDADTRSPLLLKHPNGSKYIILGIPTDDARFPRAWLILNSASGSNPIKIIPENQSFELSCSFVSNLSRDIRIDSLVLAFLQKNCKSGKFD